MPRRERRALFLNYENALCVYTPTAIAAVRAFIASLIGQSDIEAHEGGEHSIIEQLARFLAPEL